MSPWLWRIVYTECVMEIYFLLWVIILNIRLIGICKLISFKDQMCTPKCMFTNKYKFWMESLRPQMDKTRRGVQQYWIVFSETGRVAGDLNKTLTMKRLAFTWCIIRVVHQLKVLIQCQVTKCLNHHCSALKHSSSTYMIVFSSSGKNKSQKLVSRFLKIGHFVDYWLPFQWKCTVNLANQNGFWLYKCWNWSENGQWPLVISRTVLADFIARFSSCFSVL